MLCGKYNKKEEEKTREYKGGPLDLVELNGGRGSGRRPGHSFGYDSPGNTRDESIKEKYPGARAKLKEPKYGVR